MPPDPLYCQATPVVASNLQSTVSAGRPSGRTGLPLGQQVQHTGRPELGEFLGHAHCQARPLNPFRRCMYVDDSGEALRLTGLRRPLGPCSYSLGRRCSYCNKCSTDEGQRHEFILAAHVIVECP